MVDVGDLHAVEEKAVLRGTTAAHHQVVAESRRRGDTREGLDDPRDVAVAASTLLDLLEPDNTQAQWTFGGLTERCGDDVHLLDALARFFQFDRDVDIFVGNLKLGRDERLVADEGRLQAIVTRFDLRDLEITNRISDCSLRAVPDGDVGIADWLSVERVGDDALNRVSLRLCLAHDRAQQADEEI